MAPSTLLQEVEQVLQRAHPDLTLEKFDELVSTITFMANDNITRLPVAEEDKKFFENEEVRSLIKENSADFNYENGEIVLISNKLKIPNHWVDVEDIKELEELE